MPSRNTVRKNAPESSYHVYFRGLNKMPIFADDEDKIYFMRLMGRHLSLDRYVGSRGYAYSHYRGDVELVAFCVMDNHVHLLLYQEREGAVSKLLKSLMVAYCAYYNRKYDHSGSIYESRFKASRVKDDTYFTHVSRYIHLNPRSWRRYRFSSLNDIVRGTEPEWLQPERLLEQFEGRDRYLQFVKEYEGRKRELEDIKSELANS